MRISASVWVGLVTAVAVGVILGSGFRPAGGGDGDRGVIYRAPNLATVDIEQVIDDHVQKTGTAEALRNQFNSKRLALGELRDTIISMEQESEVYPRDSQKYFEIRSQIITKRSQLENQEKTSRAIFDLEQAKLTKETYEKALRAIEKIAAEKNLDLVMMKKSGRVLGSLMNEVSSSIVVRTVLFADQALDITELVKSRM